MGHPARHSSQRRKPELFGSRPIDFLRGHGWTLLLGSALLHLVILGLLPVPGVSTPLQAHELLISLQQPLEPEVFPEVIPAPPVESAEASRTKVDPAPKPGNPGPAETAAKLVTNETPAELPQSQPPLFKSSGIVTATAALQPAPAKPASTPSDNLQFQPKPHQPEVTPEPVQLPVVDVEAILLEYSRNVKARILQNQIYPATARRLGHQGQVKVGFTIDLSGIPSGISIRESSGYDSLDRAAMTVIRDAGPFKPLPEAADRESITMSITLVYGLRQSSP